MKILNSAKFFWVACACLLLLGTAIRINFAVKEAVPGGDEGPWMRLAVSFPGPNFMTSKVVEHDLYFEKKVPHPEDNRSPLYPILLSPSQIFPNPYLAAKIITILMNLALIILLCKYLFTRIPRPALLIFILFVSVSPVIITYSALVYPDVLFALCVILFCAYIPNTLNTIKSAVLGGAFLGLIFLLKSTAIFLLPGILYVLIVERFSKSAIFKSLLFGAVFTIFAAPFLVYNIYHFGSPLYQFSGYNLWIDEADYIFKAGISTPTMSEYLKDHSIFFTIVLRPILGFFTIVKEFPQFDHYLSAALFPFAILGLVSIPKIKLATFYFLIFSAFYLPLMFYLGYSTWVTRYIIMIYIALYLLAALGVKYVSEKFPSKFEIVTFIFLSILPLTTVAYPLEFYSSSRGSKANVDESAQKLIKRVGLKIPEKSAVLGFHPAMYSFMHGFNVLNQFDKIENLLPLLDNYNVQYLMIMEKENQNAIQAFNMSAQFSLKLIDKETPFLFYKILKTPDSLE